LLWVMGDSIIHWAGEWFRRQLGTAEIDEAVQQAAVSFHGFRGADVEHFKALMLKRWCMSPRRPDVVVVHIGTNNLGKTPAARLRDELDGLWTLLGCMSEQTVFLWSDILPRRDLCSPHPLDAIRKGTNRFGRRIASRAQGDFVSHPGINVADEVLFRRDGLHLSDRGQYIFIREILVAVRQSWPTRQRLLWGGIAW